MKNNKNKKGWIRVFEAITAIFLIAIVVLIILANSTVKEDNFFKEIYNAEIFILRDIQLNNTLRTEIINVATLPTIIHPPGSGVGGPPVKVVVRITFSAAAGPLFTTFMLYKIISPISVIIIDTDRSVHGGF